MNQLLNKEGFPNEWKITKLVLYINQSACSTILENFLIRQRLKAEIEKMEAFIKNSMGSRRGNHNRSSANSKKCQLRKQEKQDIGNDFNSIEWRSIPF